MNVRGAVVKVHLWMGLAASLLILALSLTGALLVWIEDLEPVFYRSLHAVDASVPRKPLEESVAAARAAHPEGRVRGLVFPQGLSGPVNVAVGRTSVFVDPHTARVLGARGSNDGLMVIETFHLNLLAGRTGRHVVGLVTVIALLSALSGLYLWWPLKIYRPRPGASGWRLDFDLHGAIGFWSSGLVVIVTLSGIIMAYEDWSRPLLLKLDGRPAPSLPEPVSQPRPDARPLPLDGVVEAANAALPGARVANFAMPGAPTDPWRVQMKFPEDKTPGGRSVVFLDQFSGEVLRVQSTREVGLGTSLYLHQRSIHTGAVWGLPTQVLALIACLALIAQVVTGLMTWWRRPSAAGQKRASAAA